MADNEAFGHSMKQEDMMIWGKRLAFFAIILALVSFGCSGGGEKSTAGKTEQKTAAQETAVKETVAPPKVVTPAPAAKMLETKAALKVEQPIPSLGMSPEEFRLRFNETSEFVKSKLRIKRLFIVAGSVQNTFKYIFNENLYLTGEVNKEDGSLAEVSFAGVLNGSLATTVDLNVCFGTIITAFSPRLSMAQRDSILYELGITNKDVDIYTLNKKITKNGITYWVKSSRATGIRFGAKSARDN